jgi:hypothetical protein
MARINSKTNWVGSDRPLAPDFNRIENNNQQAFSEIDDLGDEIDTTNSNLATTNSNLATTNINLNAEINARVAGDAGLQIQVNGKQPMPNNSTSASTFDFPVGTYVITSVVNLDIPRNTSVNIYLSINTAEYTFVSEGTRLSGTWRVRGRVIGPSALFYSYLAQRTA